MRGVVEMSWFFVGLMTLGTYVAVRAFLVLHRLKADMETIKVTSGSTG